MGQGEKENIRWEGGRKIYEMDKVRRNWVGLFQSDLHPRRLTFTFTLILFDGRQGLSSHISRFGFTPRPRARAPSSGAKDGRLDLLWPIKELRVRPVDVPLVR